MKIKFNIKNDDVKKLLNENLICNNNCTTCCFNMPSEPDKKYSACQLDVIHDAILDFYKKITNQPDLDFYDEKEGKSIKI